jgi:DNA (cytosine-5)-methyltransferase 1
VAEPFRHVDLCSGIGGFALGFQWAGLSRPVLFCDIEDWSRKVLAKHWPDVPIAEDVKELASDPGRLVPDCDILTAGYPCQPFSQAGIRRGEEDDRHIWPEIFTIVETKLPRWCVFENVSGHISLGLDQVLSELESKGYAVQPFVVPACAVDAPHRRDRVWIIAAHADSNSEPDDAVNAKSGCWELGASNVGHADCSDIARYDEATDKERGKQGLAAGCQDVADADGQRRRSWDAKRQDASDVGQPSRCQGHDARRMGAGVTQSGVGGMADGLSTRMDRFDGWEREPEDIPRVATGVKQRAARLKALGNAIVPQIAMQIGLTIKAVENG